MTAVIAIGVGCRKGCSADTIETLVRDALGQAPTATPLGLFTLVDKAGEAGLSEAADRLGLTLTYLPRESLRSQAAAVRTPSPHVEALFGVPSVAEAAALAGAGENSVLIVVRIAAGGATCAIAGVSP